MMSHRNRVSTRVLSLSAMLWLYLPFLIGCGGGGDDAANLTGAYTGTFEEYGFVSAADCDACGGCGADCNETVRAGSLTVTTDIEAGSVGSVQLEGDGCVIRGRERDDGRCSTLGTNDLAFRVTELTCSDRAWTLDFVSSSPDRCIVLSEQLADGTRREAPRATLTVELLDDHCPECEFSAAVGGGEDVGFTYYFEGVKGSE